MDIQDIINYITRRVQQVNGVSAIVLGGSRAKGTHSPQSDIDIGIYYDPAERFDLEALQKVATKIDDSHRENVLTGFYEWGTWINGGGWLRVHNYPVDFLYRDLNKVSQTIDDCLDGKITIDYYPGHPHGFINSIYLAETAHCQVLWDPADKILELKKRTMNYSPIFKEAMMQKFLWETTFSLEAAKKAVLREDISYITGCCFRSVACLNQVLFALNEQYCANEKGAVHIINTFPKAPINYKVRVNQVFDLISTKPEQLAQAINVLESVIKETEELAGSFNF